LAGAGFALVGFELGFLLGEPGFLLFVGAQALGQRTGHRVPLFVFGSENGGQRQTARPFAGELPIRPVSAERRFPDPVNGDTLRAASAVANAAAGGVGSMIVPPAVDRGGG
jgi:hypothetical protein